MFPPCSFVCVCIIFAASRHLLLHHHPLPFTPSCSIIRAFLIEEQKIVKSVLRARKGTKSA
jgi:hypothetical protein